MSGHLYFIKVDNLMVQYQDAVLVVNATENADKISLAHEHSPFCVSIDNKNDVEENFIIFLHKDYYYLNKSPFIFLNCNISSLEKEDISKKFTDQGYNIPYFINRTSGISKFHLTNKITIPIKEAEFISSLIDTNCKIIFSDVENYLFFEDFCSKISDKDNSLGLLLESFKKLHKKNHELSQLLHWQNTQLQNYKTYLMVLKRLIKDKSDFVFISPNNRLIRHLKKNPLLRKVGKNIYNIILKK